MGGMGFCAGAIAEDCGDAAPSGAGWYRDEQPVPMRIPETSKQSVKVFRRINSRPFKLK